MKRWILYSIWWASNRISAWAYRKLIRAAFQRAFPGKDMMNWVMETISEGRRSK